MLDGIDLWPVPPVMVERLKALGMDQKTISNAIGVVLTVALEEYISALEEEAGITREEPTKRSKPKTRKEPKVGKK